MAARPGSASKPSGDRRERTSRSQTCDELRAWSLFPPAAARGNAPGPRATLRSARPDKPNAFRQPTLGHAHLCIEAWPSDAALSRAVAFPPSRPTEPGRSVALPSDPRAQQAGLNARQPTLGRAPTSTRSPAFRCGASRAVAFPPEPADGTHPRHPPFRAPRQAALNARQPTPGRRPTSARSPALRCGASRAVAFPPEPADRTHPRRRAILRSARTTGRTQCAPTHSRPQTHLCSKPGPPMRRFTCGRLSPRAGRRNLIRATAQSSDPRAQQAGLNARQPTLGRAPTSVRSAGLPMRRFTCGRLSPEPADGTSSARPRNPPIRAPRQAALNARQPTPGRTPTSARSAGLPMRSFAPGRLFPRGATIIEPL